MARGGRDGNLGTVAWEDVVGGGRAPPGDRQGGCALSRGRRGGSFRGRRDGYFQGRRGRRLSGTEGVAPLPVMWRCHSWGDGGGKARLLGMNGMILSRSGK